MDAGAEVVVLLGDVPMKSIDGDYHNELHALYPDWRASVTLPSDLVERLRRAPINTRPDTIDHTARLLINQAVDVIVTPADAANLASILTWFEGLILYRINGIVNREQFNYNITAIEKTAAIRPNQFYAAPGLKILLPDHCQTLRQNEVFLPVWVDSERTPFRWSMTDSSPYIATGISYIDFHPHFRNQYTSFRDAFCHRAYVIVGKNDRRSPFCDDPGILGGVSSNDLYSTIANARAFVDAGDMHEHLVFPPIEAMAMGVPTFFTSQSALARILADEGVDEARLADLGCATDFRALDRRLEAEFDDPVALSALVERQQEVFVRQAFSRGRSLANFCRFLEKAQENMTRRGVDDHLISSYAAARLSPMPARSANAGSMPGSFGEARVLRLSPSQLRGDVGEVVRDASGQLIRRLRRDLHEEGHIIMEYLPRLDPGRYTAKLHVGHELHAPPALTASIGEWDDGVFTEISMALDHIGGATQLFCSFVISPERMGHVREIRSYWSRDVDCELHWVEFRRIETWR